MSTSDLDAYKQNRIAELNKIFVTAANNLYSTYITTVSRVMASRATNKQITINLLMGQYQINLASIKTQLSIEVSKVKLFQPIFNITSVKKKSALLIGINYIGTQYELNGCIDDSNNVKSILANQGFTQITMLNDYTATKPTKAAILAAFKTMLVSANAGDLLFFYFSGHGSYTFDRSGDETDGRDEMIIGSDLQGAFDDDFKSILSANMKDGVTIVGLFDSCYSGTMFDLKYNYLNSENYDRYTENSRVSECPGNVLMISGCMDVQTSEETYIGGKNQGALTWSFIKAIGTKPPSAISWRQLLRSMRDALRTNGFSQIPQMSTDSFYDIDSKVFL